MRNRRVEERRTFQRWFPRLFIRRSHLGNTARSVVVRTPEGCVLLIFRGPPPLSRLISIRLIGRQWSLVDRLFTWQYRGRWLHADKHPRGLLLMRLVHVLVIERPFPMGILKKIKAVWFRSLLPMITILFIWMSNFDTWDRYRTHMRCVR